MIPGAEHKTCVRYLYANCRDEDHRGVALKEKLWVVAAVYTKVDFLREIEEIKVMSIDV